MGRPYFLFHLHASRLGIMKSAAPGRLTAEAGYTLHVGRIQRCDAGSSSFSSSFLYFKTKGGDGGGEKGGGGGCKRNERVVVEGKG